MGMSKTDGVYTCQARKENAPHGAGHYLSLVARGGIEPGPRMSDPTYRLKPGKSQQTILTIPLGHSDLSNRHLLRHFVL